MGQPELETPWFESQAARCYWSNSTNMVNVEKEWKIKQKNATKMHGQAFKIYLMLNKNNIIRIHTYAGNSE